MTMKFPAATSVVVLCLLSQSCGHIAHHNEKENQKKAPSIAPVCNKKHESYTWTYYADSTCDELGKKLPRPLYMCICDDGYVRDSKWDCIEEHKCPSKCFKHREVWTFTWYEEDTCDEDGAKLKEPVRECRCEDGFVRDASGECIHPEKCPSKCTKKNEVWIYATYGDKTCDKPKVKLDKAAYACMCATGFVRSSSGECIDPDDCPPKCSKKHEVWVETWYGDKTCDAPGDKLSEPIHACRCDYGLVRDSNGECIDPRRCPPKCSKPNEIWIQTWYNDKTCNEPGTQLEHQIYACRCDYGFVRNDKGDCISVHSCPPKCTKINEVFVYAMYEDSTCDGPGARMLKPDRVCRCDDGFVRDANNNCIHETKCPPKCTKVREIWVYALYEDNTCDDYGKPMETPGYACRCEDGLVRNTDGSCIYLQQCPPKCSKAHEVWIMTHYGDKTCDAPGAKLETPQQACRCEYGYVRNTNGDCIEVHSCPPKCTKTNEKFVLAIFEDPTCHSDGVQMSQSDWGCRCVFGHVRDDQGNCIHKTSCPPKCVKANEIYVFTSYEDSTCDSSGTSKPVSGFACRCDFGFVRDASGNCILQDMCPPKCTGINEIWTFASFRDSTCNTSGAEMFPPAMACRCWTGFVRDANGVCIHTSSCPDKCKNANEVFVYASHEDPTCDGLGAQMETPSFACRCSDRYVRNSDGMCIPASDCPARCSKPNEIFVYADFEDPTCDGYGSRLSVPIRACRCYPNLVRDAAGNCIQKFSCPQKCQKANEVWSLAIDQEPTCNKASMKLPAPLWGCHCTAGYARTEAGDCVELSNCPKKCPSQNEEYVLTAYMDGTCENPGGTLLTEPKNDCRCLAGFVRNANGECIEQYKCPPSCKGQNESLVMTENEENTCKGPGAKMSSPSLACRCNPGFVRDKTNACVLQSTCPTRCTKLFEVYIKTDSEDNTCTAMGAKLTSPTFACRCFRGLVRDVNNECIPKSKCP